MDKITACKAFCLPSANINPNTLEAFSFADIDTVHQKTSSFLKSLVQVAAGVIKTSATFNSNPRSNAGSFSYIAKEGAKPHQ